MFNKKCPKCGKSIGKNFDFCPYCGIDLFDPKKLEKDYGLLGKKDIEEIDNIFGNMKLPFGFNMIAKKLMKELGKQMRKIDETQENIQPMKRTSISISISSGNGKPIRIIQRKPIKIKNKNKIKKESNLSEIDEKTAKKLAKLPKHEAKTTVKRLSNKIIYEISLPEVKTIKDIIINKLENSIEIKAFSKDKAYFKILPVNLDILNYKLREGKLILELDT